MPIISLPDKTRFLISGGFGVWPAWLVLALSLVLTFGAWRYSTQVTENHVRAEFDAEVAQIRADLDARIAAYTQVLRGAAALFAASDKVTREHWRAYIAGLQLERNFPAIQAVAYARDVGDPELDDLVREMRAGGIADFAMRPAGRRARYVVNVYTEPYTGLNPKALGYDMWQDAERRETMERARGSGEPVITHRITLKIDEQSNPVPAFIMYLPVFGKSGGAVHGYVLSPFRMPVLMADLLRRGPRDVELTIHDGTDPRPGNLFYRSDAQDGRAAPRFTYSETVTVGARPWTLNYASLPGLDARVDANQPALVLAAGLVASLLLFGLVWMLSTTRERTMRVARHMTRSLRESETKLYALFSQAPLAIWMLDDTGRVIDCNEKFLESAGASRDKIIGFNLLDEVRDRTLVQPIRRALAGETVNIETEYTSTTGNRRTHSQYHFQPVKIDGKFAFLLCFAQDISERKRAEAALRESEDKFRKVVEQSPLSMALVGMDGTIEYINRKAIETFGYLPEDIPVMERWWVQAYPDETYRAEVIALWMGLVADAIEHNHEIEQREYRVTCKNGVVKTAAIFGVPIVDKVLVIFQDVTERARTEAAARQFSATLERRVRERTAELEASNRELESFSYSISHDLRAPLRALHGYSHLLSEEYAQHIDAQGQHYLARIRIASERMGEMIDDMLDLARVARQELNRQPVDLGAQANEIRVELKEQHPERVVTWDIDADLMANADPVLMKTLLDNLLRNAWKFTAERAQAHIAFFASGVDGERVYCVRDNGAGFEMAYADKLFKPFERLHDVKRFEGTGIGLAIVQRILQRHGGRVWAESAPGNGAAFYFTLPRT